MGPDWQTFISHDSASGLQPGDDLDSKTAAELPYVLDREFLIQSLLPDFPHQMLLGMDVVGMCEFRMPCSGIAELQLP